MKKDVELNIKNVNVFMFYAYSLYLKGFNFMFNNLLMITLNLLSVKKIMKEKFIQPSKIL